MAGLPITGFAKDVQDSACIQKEVNSDSMRKLIKCELKSELVEGGVRTTTVHSDQCENDETRCSSSASSNRASLESAVILSANSKTEIGVQTSNSLLSNIFEQINAKRKRNFENSARCKADKVVINERDTWDKKAEFLLAVIGFAVDLGNVWRFPFVCYRNGGGAFLIPYLVMLVFGGFPLFYLELALGQYYRSGCLTLWTKICPVVKGIGYAICFLDLYVGMYYNTIIAWAVYYLFSSFTSELPWTRCDNDWNTKKCRLLHQRGGNASIDATSPAQEFFERKVLENYKANGIESIGPIKLSLAICLLFVFILVYFSLWKGVKSAGKAVWITATMPYFVLTILLIRGITLDGSMVGIKYYLYPQWDKLLEFDVWIDAATQIFFSLGPGFGTLLAFSSYNKFNNNCYRDAIFTSGVNCFTSFIAGFVIFSVLGYMADVLDKDVSTVAADGPGLVFIVYPEAIATMQGSVFWSILFFVMLITLGLDSTFGGLEAIITGLCDEYPNVLRKNREIFVAVLILMIYLCALPTTTFGGSYVVHLLDSYGTSLSVLFIVFLETVTVCWFFGIAKFSEQVREMLGFAPGLFWRICWTYISPMVLLMIFTGAVIQHKDLEWQGYNYPNWSVAIGWCLTFSSLLCVPIYGTYCFVKTKGTLSERIAKIFRPENVGFSGDGKSSQCSKSDYAQV